MRAQCIMRDWSPNGRLRIPRAGLVRPAASVFSMTASETIRL